MPQDFGKCVPKIEETYFLLENAGIDPKIQRALASSLFIYALQSGPEQKERASFKLNMEFCRHTNCLLEKELPREANNLYLTYRKKTPCESGEMNCALPNL